MSETDLELLARYSRQKAEDAFAELVRRHLGFVYSAALRQVRSPQLAEEVSQSAFIKLASQASRLAADTVLSAWLYQVTRREAIDVVRREARRQLREQIASEMNVMNATAADWTHIEPLLDEAMHSLDDIDRTAVLLRYFENKSLREVGATLRTTDNAARKRVNRAVESLREFFAKRGVTVATSGLVVVVSANAVQAAPDALAQAVMAAAKVTATKAGASNPTLIQTLKVMASTKLKTVAVVGTFVFLAGATAVILDSVFAAHPATAPDISGAWEGLSEIPAAGVGQGEKARTRVVFRFFKTNGAYTAIGEIIDAAPARYQATEFVYEHPSVRIQAGPNESFQGTLNAGANEIAGIIQMQNYSQPLLLKRTATPATAHVPLADGEYAPRAGSDLQGFWTGRLGNGAGGVRVTVKIAEPVAGTFRAELDNLTGPWLGQPLKVTYRQPEVTLLIASGAGMFEGTLNNDSSEMTGRWVQDGRRTPATFRRSDASPRP